jgi:hypothetical protein
MNCPLDILPLCWVSQRDRKRIPLRKYQTYLGQIEMGELNENE